MQALARHLPCPQLVLGLGLSSDAIFLPLWGLHCFWAYESPVKDGDRLQGCLYLPSSFIIFSQGVDASVSSASWPGTAPGKLPRSAFGKAYRLEHHKEDMVRAMVPSQSCVANVCLGWAAQNLLHLKAYNPVTLT